MGNLAPITGKLEKLIPRLGTDSDAEAIATIRAIQRTLKSNGSDWHDLAAVIKAKPDPIHYQTYTAPKPRQRYQSRDPDRERFVRMAYWLRDKALSRLSPNSRSFVMSMVMDLGAGRGLTDRQKQYLADLFVKNGGVL